jgi:hypothetical protein
MVLGVAEVSTRSEQLDRFGSALNGGRVERERLTDDIPKEDRCLVCASVLANADSAAGAVEPDGADDQPAQAPGPFVLMYGQVASGSRARR